jgi:hypothetical protein
VDHIIDLDFCYVWWIETCIAISNYFLSDLSFFSFFELVHLQPVRLDYEIPRDAFAILILAISITLIFTGPGKISIEWDILKRELIPLGNDMVSSIRELQQHSDRHHTSS